MRQEWYNYGTAWQLNDSAFLISIVILGLHLAIALTHTVVAVRYKHTSDSWDSIAELISLVCNSHPPQNALENCGAGIRLHSTLNQRVKVMAVEEKESDSAGNVELVFCDREAEGNGGEAFGQVNRLAVEEGKKYR